MREPTADDLARLGAVERFLQRVVQHPTEEVTFAAHRASLRDAALHDADRAALLRTGAHRLGVYRRMVRATFVDAIASEMPLAAARLEHRFGDDVHDFVTSGLPTSPILRDVAFEFVAFALPRWRTSAPRWLGDLARFELLEFDAHCAVGAPEVDIVKELPADRPLVFDGTCRIGLFDHAVHELPIDGRDRSEPRLERHGMLLHRDAAHRVRRVHLSPVAASIMVQLLVERRPLADAVRTGTAAEACPMSEHVITAISTILDDLVQRGALLGSTADGLAPPPSRWTQLVKAAG